MDEELVALGRIAIGMQEFGLTQAQAARLRGASPDEVRADARQMCKELGVPDPTERGRDEGGRFVGGMNQRIRAAAGRS
jgi:ABC-type dipeptide/oligopeptide/nickel transport system ATPase component